MSEELPVVVGFQRSHGSWLWMKKRTLNIVSRAASRMVEAEVMVEVGDVLAFETVDAVVIVSVSLCVVWFGTRHVWTQQAILSRELWLLRIRRRRNWCWWLWML